MKVSARNVFPGTIRRVVRGPVSTGVTIRIAAGLDIVSVITTPSCARASERTP
ncbi:MAG TPA: TOBE domain-containing protein [Steroidobacteraceae bacterium]|nr:TOBE domain-containing protein [Steroidobacteraceae bacterium]